MRSKFEATRIYSQGLNLGSFSVISQAVDFAEAKQTAAFWLIVNS